MCDLAEQGWKLDFAVWAGNQVNQRQTGSVFLCVNAYVHLVLWLVYWCVLVCTSA